MTKNQAEKKGYSYTGVYSRDMDNVKARIVEEKAKGNRAVLVTEPISKYSRSANRAPGYSMYVIKSAANLRAEGIERCKARAAHIECEMEKHRQELKRLGDQLTAVTGELNAWGEK